MKRNRGSKMIKRIGRISIWGIGLICMVFVCMKMVHPITEKELINSEKYLITSELKSGDVLEQSITLQREGLSSIDVAFVYGDSISDECKALVEIVSDGEVLTQSTVQVKSLPNQTLTSFDILRGCGGKLTLRITNVSEKQSENQFSLLYTDSKVRMFDNVTQFKINNQTQEGQLISQYTYKTGYDYYTALSVAFLVFLICMTLETVLLKKCKENHYEN